MVGAGVPAVICLGGDALYLVWNAVAIVSAGSREGWCGENSLRWMVPILFL